jgi:hypothetical protein
MYRAYRAHGKKSNERRDLLGNPEEKRPLGALRPW